MAATGGTTSSLNEVKSTLALNQKYCLRNFTSDMSVFTREDGIDVLRKSSKAIQDSCEGLPGEKFLDLSVSRLTPKEKPADDLVAIRNIFSFLTVFTYPLEVDSDFDVTVKVGEGRQQNVFHCETYYS